MKSNGPFVKPAKLSHDFLWVAVAEVHKSDGAHPDEKTWGTVVIGTRSTERAATDSAIDWFNETDQSEECELTLSVERADGSIVAHRVRVSVAPTARIVRETPGERNP
jgi:hypothetical protein